MAPGVVDPVTGELPLGPMEPEGEDTGETTGGVATGTDELISKVPLGAGTRGVDTIVEEAVSVTGQTVVEMGMVEVTTDIDSAGQSVTVGAQLVMVYSLVAYTVDVVHEEPLTGVVEPVTSEVPSGIGREDDPMGELVGTLATGTEEFVGKTPLGAGTRGVETTVETAVSVTGQTVVEIGIVEVTTDIDSAGQSVTVGAQLVIVYSLVA